MQWSIGFSRGNIEQIIRDKNCALSFKWTPLTDSIKSIADPFIFKDAGGNINLVYEDFSMIDTSKYGKIVMAAVDNEFNTTGNKEILDTKSHCSYPFVFVENDKTYIIPETSHQCKVSGYEYDFENKCLINERIIINDLPLLDSTIVKYNSKYWLFASLSGNGIDPGRLNIYYADSLFGTYQPHANNPVNMNVDGSRPAGNVIQVDGELYRPAQNCGQHYGESITINKITKLSENEFSEKFHFRIKPDKSSEFNSGVHTINVVDDIIVIDGIKMIFKPLTKWMLFFKKRNKKINIPLEDNHEPAI